jgi:hypothetical protein
MDQAFARPTTTAFDATTTAITAVAYLAVAMAGLVTAPRDVRARVFTAVALLNVGPAAGSVLLWREGDSAAFTPSLVAMLAITTFAGSLALFHFTQVFPAVRPWIERHGRWLAAGYVVVVLGPTGLFAVLPRSVDDVTVVSGLAFLAIALSLIGTFAIVVPLAGLVSLYKSYLAARDARSDAVARATLWMLISQVGGGILAAILLPLLHMLSLPVVWTTAASALFFAFGIMMPLAYAAAVWKFRLLDASTAAGRA